MRVVWDKNTLLKRAAMPLTAISSYQPTWGSSITYEYSTGAMALKVSTLTRRWIKKDAVFTILFFKTTSQKSTVSSDIVDTVLTLSLKKKVQFVVRQKKEIFLCLLCRQRSIVSLYIPVHDRALVSAGATGAVALVNFGQWVNFKARYLFQTFFVWFFLLTA